MKDPAAMHRPVAYKDEDFLDSEDARPLRILAEYLQPLHAFRRLGVRDTIVFFGSARLSEDGPLGRYYQDARELARLVTVWSKGHVSHEHRYVVCSGAAAASWRRYADDPATALSLLQAALAPEAAEPTPAFAHSRTPKDPDGS